MNIVLSGPLPNNRRLTKPLPITIEWDDGEWIVSEPRYHMHAAGPTLAQAITAFCRIFSDYLDVLNEHENRPMAQHLHEQLAYLREMIEQEVEPA